MTTVGIVVVAAIFAIVILGLTFALVYRDAVRHDYIITGTLLSFRIARRVPPKPRPGDQPAVAAVPERRTA